jgi:RNA polymerase sigma-70 factor (ECF subfamily)
VAAAIEHKPNTEVPAYLADLFWAHYDRVLRAAYRITGNLADAEDVAQSVFLRLAASSEVKIDNAESYLYRAALNGALDLIRRRQSDREVALDGAAELASSAPASSPERHLSDRELRQWLRIAIGRLSVRAGEMFVLRFVEGLSNREIAHLMGTSQAVVAVMLHQARAKLKKQFRSFQRGTR